VRGHSSPGMTSPPRVTRHRRREHEGRAERHGEPRPDAAHDDSIEGGSLIAHDRCVDYRSRWDVVQGDFIDEPRKAVTDADTLVGEILDHLAETFREQWSRSPSRPR
jgi:hypothetical protein